MSVCTESARKADKTRGKEKRAQKEEKEAQRGKWEHRQMKAKFDFLKLFNETTCMKKSKGDMGKKHPKSISAKIDGDSVYKGD